MQKILERFFDISPDASASVLITLLIFFLGYLITSAVFLISRYLTRKSSRKIFIANLISLNKSLNRQVKGFEKVVESFNIVTNSPWLYEKVEFFQLSVFKEMSYKETFKSYFIGLENQTFCSRSKRELRRKAFNKTWANFNNAELWGQKAFADFYPILEKYNQFGDKRNDSVNRLRKTWEHFFSEGTASLSKDEFEYLKELDSLVSTFQRIPTNQRVTPYITHRNLILKIRILNKKYPPLNFTRQFGDLALEASNHYHNMELLIRHTRDQYKAYYYAYRTVVKTNEKIIKILE